MKFFKNENIESIKHIVEVVAIIIGGWWAYHNFNRVSQPTLAIREKAESTLK